MQKNESEFLFDESFSNFTTVVNDIFDDVRVTDKAIGLYCRIVRKRNIPGWKIYQSALEKPLDGKTSIRSSMKNLIETGYIERERIRDEKGRLTGSAYRVYPRSIKPINKEEEEIFQKKVSKKNSKKISKNKNKTSKTVGTSQSTPKLEKPTLGNQPLKNKDNKNKDNIYKDNIYNLSNLSNNTYSKKYCSLQDKEVVERQIEELREYIGEFRKWDYRKFLNEAIGDVELIKYVYDNAIEYSLRTDTTIENLTAYILGGIKKEYKNFN